MKYNKDLYFIVSSSCQLTKGYRMTLLQDFSRKSLEYIPNDYYMLTKLLDRNKLGEVTSKIASSSMESFEKYLNFMLDKEYAFLVKDISTFPAKDRTIHDTLFPINDAIIEFDFLESNLEEMYYYLNELNLMQCPYLQIRFLPPCRFNYIKDVLNKICMMDFECVEVHVADSHNIPINIWNELIFANVAVSRIYLYNQSQSEVLPYNVEPIGNESLLMGEVITIKHSLDVKNCGNINKYSMQFFNEDFYEISKHYNSCLYKKIAINKYGHIKNCLFLDKDYSAANGLQRLVRSEDFRKCWYLKKDSIKICQDCEFRYNCLDCRACSLLDKLDKPQKCNYNPYKLAWDDDQK